MSFSWLSPRVALGAAAKMLKGIKYAPSFSMLPLSRMYRNLVGPPASFKAGKIRQVGIRITELCNLRCHTCGQWGDHGFLRGKSIKEIRQDELTVSDYKAIFDDLAANGHHPLIYLWGGEPTLYDGYLDVVAYGESLGMHGTIATNGARVERDVKEIVSIPFVLVQISVDGPDEASHNSCRPGAAESVDSFSTVCTAIESLDEEKKRQNQALPVVATLTVVSERNEGRLLELYDKFADKVDVMVFYLGWWIDEERAIAHEEDYASRFTEKPTTHRSWLGDWRPSSFEALSAELTELIKRGRNIGGPTIVVMPKISAADQLETYYTDHSSTFGHDFCPALYTEVEISANGIVTPCRDYRDYVVGSLKENTLSQLWNSQRYIDFRRSLAKGLMPVCSRCCGLMGL
mgnify:CR=1 FL=1